MSYSTAPIITFAELTPNPVSAGAPFIIKISIEECTYGRLETYTHAQLEPYTYGQLESEKLKG
ncbi:MAG: hypothetical protein Q8865_05475 [Bacillota bacterium]|nr:hypothetical protein [Bacillota bacterium]